MSILFSLATSWWIIHIFLQTRYMTTKNPKGNRNGTTKLTHRWLRLNSKFLLPHSPIYTPSACFPQMCNNFHYSRRPIYTLKLLMWEHLNAPDMAPLFMVQRCFINMFDSQTCNNFHYRDNPVSPWPKTALKSLINPLFTTQRLHRNFLLPDCGRHSAVSVE